MNMDRVFGAKEWATLMCYLNQFDWVIDTFNFEVDIVDYGLDKMGRMLYRADFARYYSYVDAKGNVRDVGIQIETTNNLQLRVSFAEDMPGKMGWGEVYNSGFFTPKGKMMATSLKEMKMLFDERGLTEQWETGLE